VLFLVVLLYSGVLVLMVIGDEVVHVALCLDDLHPFMPSLVYVPVQEGLALKHGCES
jgi:hypothetical protein